MTHDIVRENQISLHSDGVELHSNIVTHKHSVRKVHRAIKNHVPNPDPPIKRGATQTEILEDQGVIRTSPFDDQAAFQLTINKILDVPLEQTGYDSRTTYTFQVSPLSFDNTDQMFFYKYT
jgi:hypothetical protein